MAEKLTFTAYTDLALARLYEAEERDGSSQVIDLYDLMADITDQGIDREWAYQAAQWIVAHGYGHDFLTNGSATTQLTGDGRMYVEAGTGIISDYQQSPQIVVVSGDGNQVAVGHGQTVNQRGEFSQEEITELLDQAETVLQADATLSDTDRDDALAGRARAIDQHGGASTTALGNRGPHLLVQGSFRNTGPSERSSHATATKMGET